MFKFSGFIFGAALLLLAGCATPPNDLSPDGMPPREWTITNAVPVRPAHVPTNPIVLPPPPVKPAPVLTWSSLNDWAKANKLTAPRKVAGSPVATYAVNSPKGTMTFTIGSREANWRGMEIYLGFAPEIIDDQIFVHGLDLQKNLEPLLLETPLPLGTNRIVVIDPGHGGSNAGTHSLVSGRNEKEFTLDWALRIRSLLATNGWKVFLTRTDDSDVTLSNRVAFADACNADVFISLHFNSAAPSRVQSGIETYCLTPTGMPSTLTRNYSDLWTDRYPNNVFDDQNFQLAVRLHEELLRASGEEDRGVRRARFMGVLQGQRRPAVLVEGGFLSNPAEARKIESPEFRQKLAAAVAAVFRQPVDFKVEKQGVETNLPAQTPAIETNTNYQP